MNGAIGADRHGGAQNINRLSAPDRHGNHFRGLPGFLQLNGLFNRNSIEGVHRHAGELDVRSGMVRERADLDLRVNDPLHSN